VAGNDINAWRRQNSDVVNLEIVLADGTILKGDFLQPRDKSLREVFNMPDPFVDLDCALNGPTIIAKTQIRSLRLNVPLRADQIEKREKQLEKSDAWGALGLPRNADREAVRKAYISLAHLYHPDRYSGVDLPKEVAEYMNAMARRINGAYAELNALLGQNARTDAAA
jgi:hypothetical protein